VSGPAPALERPVETAAPAVRTGAAVLVLLSLGHFFVDLYSGAVGALQPLLVERLNLSLAEAGILGGVFVFTSSVLQLAFGMLSDHLRTRLFAALAPLVAGVSISLLGVAPSYWLLLALVSLGGFGIAAFHPQASATVAFGTATRRGGWMAVFISAGTLGFSLGPAYFSGLLELGGAENLYWAAAPAILVSALLLMKLPAPPAAGKERSLDLSPLRRVWRPLAVLYSLVFIRSILQIVFAQFLPLYLTLERGFAYADANYVLTLYLVAGALGGFFGGHLADRFGGRTVILLSMAGCVPFLLLFFLGEGWLAVAGLIAGGLVLFFTIPVNVVMAQELVPSQAGTVSALMMGFAWGMAGVVFIPLTGRASDAFAMHPVLLSLMVFPVIGFLLALKLEKGGRK